ncbi:hypothetical protein DPMN_106407 [Dreissena polymorpha]|uniref:Uncharacterized protein n=1 Tax=Dreissena polymorpha TaxID=45954 RepID=A0A9D4K4X3_DREPO|nr:hypothetical protein DPMN_106407 [Dreissena polymorpha]
MTKGETVSDKLKFVKRDSLAKGFMAWAGVLIEEKPRFALSTEELKLKAIFISISASSHASKQTLQFLKKEKVNLIDRDEWMTKSPDAVPMDFGIWEILKRRIQKRNVNSVIVSSMSSILDVKYPRCRVSSMSSILNVKCVGVEGIPNGGEQLVSRDRKSQRRLKKQSVILHIKKNDARVCNLWEDI